MIFSAKLGRTIVGTSTSSADTTRQLHGRLSIGSSMEFLRLPSSTLRVGQHRSSINRWGSKLKREGSKHSWTLMFRPRQSFIFLARYSTLQTRSKVQIKVAASNCWNVPLTKSRLVPLRRECMQSAMRMAISFSERKNSEECQLPKPNCKVCITP
jgi:hypothetical protein